MVPISCRLLSWGLDGPPSLTTGVLPLARGVPAGFAGATRRPPARGQLSFEQIARRSCFFPSAATMVLRRGCAAWCVLSGARQRKPTKRGQMSMLILTLAPGSHAPTPALQLVIFGL